MRKHLMICGLSVLGVFTFAVVAPKQVVSQVGTTKPDYIDKGSAWQIQAFKHGEVQRQIEQTRYKGTSAIPHPDATGRTRQMQTRVAQAFSKTDFVPNDRLQYFRGNAGLTATVVTGWKAQIIEMTPLEQGFQFQVKIEPQHDADTGLYINDYLVESYIYADGQIQYLGATKPDSRGVVTFN